MAAAMHFGLAYELWAKLPLESGYAAPGSEEAPAKPQLVSERKDPNAAPKAATASPAPSAAVAKESEATEATFREFLLEKGVHTVAIDACVGIVKDKLGGDWAKGTKQVGSKSAEELNSKYGPKEESEASQW